jgi:phosphoribosylglycinamide formyltransferase 1
MIRRLAILASGNGSNAQRLMEHFFSHPSVRVTLLLSNNPEALVLERARKMHVPVVTFSREDFYHTQHILDLLSVQGIDWIILAGFLWLIPTNILKFYPNRILNIHPALLPKHGGKGMYGMKVHEAVIQSRDTESGITIHYVNEKYDDGQVIFQAKCQITPEDSAETLAGKVHELEYRWYPEIIEQTLKHHPSTVI